MDSKAQRVRTVFVRSRSNSLEPINGQREGLELVGVFAVDQHAVHELLFFRRRLAGVMYSCACCTAICA